MDNHFLRRPPSGLGFGCGQLHAGWERTKSIRLLETAIDCGFTWFDTARLYGHGEAESLLGTVLPAHRQTLTVVSKAGILPSRITFAWRLHAKVAALSKRLPIARTFARQPPPAYPIFGVFAPHQLKASVEQSLRALRTDYLDLLLLHECSVDNAKDPKVLELLDTLKREGKIRAYGTATSSNATADIAKAKLPYTAFQFASTIWDERTTMLRQLTSHFLITHSILAKILPIILQKVSSDMTLHARFELLGLTPTASALAPRLIALARYFNPNGVVLFSSSRMNNIRSALSVPHMTEQEFTAFNDLMLSYRPLA